MFKLLDFNNQEISFKDLDNKAFWCAHGERQEKAFINLFNKLKEEKIINTLDVTGISIDQSNEDSIKNAIKTISGEYKVPDILINSVPADSISIVISVAPASIEFSNNSFTAEAGLSITSPAAILFAISSDKT